MAIGYCESGQNPKAIGLNKKDGKVWSRDFGWFQVNDYYHFSKAKALGYNLRVAEQSFIYGLVLLKQEGLKYWSASRTCFVNYKGQGISSG